MKTLRLGLALTLFWAMAGTASAQPASGAVRGTLYDADFSVPVSGARVTILGTQLAAVSDDNGNFAIENVPAGTYTVVFARSGYERKLATGVIVTPGQLADLGNVPLSVEVVDLPPLIVTGDDALDSGEIGLLEVRQETSNVLDAISLEEIQKAGAGDVAGALTKVTGTSVRDGKYATVRGLSDRYTGTTLNGVRIPSADPRVRAVQVDLFPTGTVESVNVTKTFTPDLQGDFTGGGIDIITKSIPEKRILSISLSVEHDSIATDNPGFLTYAGAGIDSDAKAGPERGLPAAASGDFPQLSPAALNPTPAQIEAAREFDTITRSFVPVIGTMRKAPDRNTGWSIVAGNSYRLWDKESKIGVLGALTYSEKRSFFDNGQNNQGVVSSANSPVEIDIARSDSKGSHELLIGGLGSLAFRINDGNEINLRAIINRGAEDSARFQVRDVSPTQIEQNQSLQYIEREMISTQLSGSHEIPSIPMPGDPREVVSFDWFVADNSTSQDEPDVRFFRNVFDRASLGGAVPPNSTDAKNSRRIFRNVQEDNKQYAVNVKVPFTQWGGEEGRFRFGVYSERSDRAYTQDSFTYTFPGQLGGFLNPIWFQNVLKGQFSATSPDDLWTDVFLDDDRIGLAGPTCVAPQNPFFAPCVVANQLLWTIIPLGDDVNYTGLQEIDASYWMFELPLHSRLELIAGMRREKTVIKVDPVNLRFGVVEVIETTDVGTRSVVTVPQEQARTDIEQQDNLPSVSLNWHIPQTAGDMYLRSAWSRTIARPTFRELAPVATEEFIFGDEFLGNPEIVLSSITNYDLRWDWYRGSGELLSASVFKKELTNPIELISFSTTNRAFVQPLNFETGRVKGVELEARTDLGWITGSLSGLTLGANYTILDTEVDVPEAEQISLSAYGLDSPIRRLQGQPDNLLNINVNWDDAERGVSAGLSYNRVGVTLDTGAARGSTDGNPNVFQDPYATLDVFFKKSWAMVGSRPGMAFTFRAKNLSTPERTRSYSVPGFPAEVKTLKDTALRISVGMSFSF